MVGNWPEVQLVVGRLAAAAVDTAAEVDTSAVVPRSVDKPRVLLLVGTRQAGLPVASSLLLRP